MKESEINSFEKLIEVVERIAEKINEHEFKILHSLFNDCYVEAYEKASSELLERVGEISFANYKEAKVKYFKEESGDRSIKKFRGFKK
jgi:hypothetical protein